ncbi:SpoIIE family protein phosphatase [Embleya sp. NPDC008237]|uniref:SpoIIE family protein phosphatase n=1 Tax=Embleya sp. NPDC008237 TaxID=3363978 RepID=UPI0036E4B0CE
MTRVWDIPVHDSTRIRDVRVATERAAAAAGLASPISDRAVLVASELVTNLLKHAGGGRVLIESLPHGAAPRHAGEPGTVQILALDHGPGIADITAATGDGFSSSGSLGIGLGTCRRLSDSFDLHPGPGHGTVALARLGPRPDNDTAPSLPIAHVGGLHVPLAGAPHSGDAWSHTATADSSTVMLADGLGHGPPAAEATDVAVRVLHRHPELAPHDLLETLDTALRGTRGAAIAIARIDATSGRLTFAGVGNVGARIRTPQGWDHLVSRPGVVGAYRHTRPPAPQHRPWTGESTLILHSDGLPSRWHVPDDPDIEHRDPTVIAAVILRDTLGPGSPVRDDTTLAVVTARRPPEPSMRRGANGR